MNSNKLARFYDTLSPDERFPLIVNACSREDELERRRLIAACPEINLRVCDYHFRALALERISYSFVCRQLELLLRCSRAVGVCYDFEGGIPNHIFDAASQFEINSLGWREFCTTIGVEPTLILAGIPGYELIQQSETWMSALVSNRLSSSDLEIASQEIAAAMLEAFKTAKL